jgi:hypothetical protein
MKGATVFEEALARPEEAAPAPEEPLADRLRSCSRLLSLAADEVAALGRGDGARRRELAEAREELVEEMFASRVEGEEEGAILRSIPERIAELLIEALTSLEQREEEERQMQDRWSLLEEDALRAMHVGGRIVSPRAGRYENRFLQDKQLDVRF